MPLAEKGKGAAALVPAQHGRDPERDQPSNRDMDTSPSRSKSADRCRIVISARYPTLFFGCGLHIRNVTRLCELSQHAVT